MMRRKRLRIAIFVLALVFVGGVISAAAINGYVKHAAGDVIIPFDAARGLQDVDCVLILGCAVRDDGIPTPMLADRLERGVELYESGASGKLLMSGDHGRKGYDEVNVMKQYAIDAGVPSGDVFMDHAGFSTYESIYRAKAIFEAKRIIIVTQSYHLPRALYTAAGLGLDAYGVGADQREYMGQEYREAREILARVKDFFWVIFKPEPTFLGEIIPVSGDGDLTND